MLNRPYHTGGIIHGMLLPAAVCRGKRPGHSRAFWGRKLPGPLTFETQFPYCTRRFCVLIYYIIFVHVCCKVRLGLLQGQGGESCYVVGPALVAVFVSSGGVCLEASKYIF